MATLEDWAGELLGLLPDDSEAETVELSTAVLPEVPAVMECHGLVIRHGFHEYDTWRIDYPQWSAAKPTYGALGLAILASLLHRLPRLTLQLTNRRSDVRALVVEEPPLREWSTGL